MITGAFNQNRDNERRPADRTVPAASGGELRARPVRLTLLGGFAADGWMPKASPSSPWRFAAYLAIHGPTPRSRMAGLLWPDAHQSNAQASLRSALWRLRAQCPEVVDAQRDSLDLGRRVSSDLESFLATVRHVLASETCDPLDCARIIAARELTPEWGDEWIDTAREELRQLRLRALGVLADRLLAARRLELAYQVTLAELSTDPLREIAHRRMIRLHLIQGDVAQARQQYEACVALLRTELGVRPSPRTTNLLPNDMAILDETVGVM